MGGRWTRRSKRLSVRFFFGNQVDLRVWIFYGCPRTTIDALTRAMHVGPTSPLSYSDCPPDHDIQQTGNVSTHRGHGDIKYCHLHIALHRLSHSTHADTFSSCVSWRHAHRSDWRTSTPDRISLWDEFSISHSLPRWITLLDRHDIANGCILT